MKASMDALDLGRRFPLPINRCEAARVQHLAARRVAYVEQVLAEVRRIDELRPASRPGAVVDDAIERERLVET